MSLSVLGRHETGAFDQGAAEIPAFDPGSKRLFVVNGATPSIDVLDLSDPANPTKVAAIDVTLDGAAANSVASKHGLVAVAIEADPKQAPGKVLILRAKTLERIAVVEVGALPDMLTFTPNGRYVLVANEGEPDDFYRVDPEGSVSIIDLHNLKKVSVAHARFTAFNGQEAALREQGIRIFGPAADPERGCDEAEPFGATAAQDIEPESIAVSENSKTAYVTLQENNALAVIDVRTAAVTAIHPLGVKDHAVDGQGLDPSDRDRQPPPNNQPNVAIVTRPVLGLYQPDAVARYSFAGAEYLVMANEGDVRTYPMTDLDDCDEGDVFNEAIRVSSLDLDDATFAPNEAALKGNGPAGIGRLNVSVVVGDDGDDGDYESLHPFGARSFSIRRSDGTLVWDSGDAFEQNTAGFFPDHFNASNTNNSLDNRSDDKGPEPEGVTLGEIGGRTYAFIGLERIGGVMVYDVTDPQAPSFADYVNPRDFTKDPEDELAAAGDLGPEGLAFIPADASPNGLPLLVVANEVSGTTTVYQVNGTP